MRRFGLLLGAVTGTAALMNAGNAHEADSASVAQLSQMNIEDLANIQITSVSKQAEPLSSAPSAVYVITHDDVIRSGANSIPEMLRLAPNLEVAQISANTYAISARGFNGQIADKLLVLIDGRSVYTPIYAGVYWDMQYVPPEDVERIEVISGPGGTLWGANAVNGVINIITRKSSDTQGGVLGVQAGNRGYEASFQYGGTLVSDLSYRVYAEGFSDRSDKTSAGANAEDGWSRPQAGFRLDWTPPDDTVTVQGNLYRGAEDATATVSQDIAGENLQAIWEHRLSGGSSLQVQAYYDYARRFVPDGGGGGGDQLKTYDIDVQHSFTLGGWNAIVWGAGERVDEYKVYDEPGLLFSPNSGTLNYANIFVEDTMSLSDSVKLIAGSKIEHDPYVGFEFLPSLRTSWKVTDADLLWAAVSRVVRSPTPFDRDAQGGGSPPLLIGGANFQSEKLTAYEVGYRTQPTPSISLSISTFYNDYTSLRSIDFTPTFFPVEFANFTHGHTYGVEMWGNYKVTDWWRLSAGFNIQHENLTFDVPLTPGFLAPYEAPVVPSLVNQIIGYTGDDPSHQVSLRSSMNLPYDVTLDAEFREVGALPNPAVPGYIDLDMHIGWKVTKTLQLSLTGSNLLRPYHVEYIGGATTVEIPRSIMLGAQTRF